MIYKHGLMKYTGIIFLLVLLASCSGTKKESVGEVLISGHITNMGEGDVLLERFEGASLEVVDTFTVMDDGMFSSSYRAEEPGYYRINFYQTQFVTLILTDERITVEVDAKSPMSSYSITGSEAMDNIKKIEDIMSDFTSGRSQLEANFREAANNEDEATMEKLRGLYIVEQQGINERIKSEIRNMISSAAVLQAINYLDKDAEFEFVDSVATVVDNNLHDYKIKREFLNQICKLRKVAIDSKST